MKERLFPCGLPVPTEHIPPLSLRAGWEGGWQCCPCAKGETEP